MGRVSESLPDFPWDSLAEAKATAAAHPDGIVDLSVGTPVDPVDSVIVNALTEAAAFPGYPATIGTDELRTAIADELVRRWGIEGLPRSGLLPVIGTKEAIASLPSMLNVGGTVVIPELAYPTYEVGAVLAGARVLRADSITQIGPDTSVELLFINSPANPHGKILGAEHLEKVVTWARHRNVIVVSDECYLGLAWDDLAVSILHPTVSGGDFTNLIAVHSLSKTSNLASYRAGFLAGDPVLIGELTAVRRHAGLMVPYPIQAAMVAALSDDVHERQQKGRYHYRRDVLSAAVRGAGFRIDDSDGGLYLWATRDEPCRDTVAWFADRGILVAPGEFYGPRGARHVRIALTATDERIAAAATRLKG